jgi:spore photoproduct lyase
MFPSPNLVVFVNSADFIATARHELASEPSYLCISYDTDLLALENLFGYSEAWIEFADQSPRVLVELRTKSANFRAISHLRAPPNLILAWTLSPNDVTSRFEHGTPSLEARCRSIREAQERGWRVRLCFDPLLLVPNWRASYSEMLPQIAALVDLDAVCDISIGVFRINGTYLRNMQEKNPSSALLAHPLSVENGSASYSQTSGTSIFLHGTATSLRLGG